MLLTSSRTSTTTTFLSAERSVERSSAGVTRGREPGLAEDGGDDIEEAEAMIDDGVFVLCLGPATATAAAAAPDAARRRDTLCVGFASRAETEESIVCMCVGSDVG